MNCVVNVRALYSIKSGHLLVGDIPKLKRSQIKKLENRHIAGKREGRAKGKGKGEGK